MSVFLVYIKTVQLVVRTLACLHPVMNEISGVLGPEPVREVAETKQGEERSEEAVE